MGYQEGREGVWWGNGHLDPEYVKVLDCWSVFFVTRAGGDKVNVSDVITA